MDEYLEGIFERSFEREVVQEERVFNSLSFFVAALALTVNVLGYIAAKMPVFRLSFYSLTTYGLMVLAALLMVGVMWSLFDGVRQRVYRIPPKETDTLEWATSLRDYYLQSGLRDQSLDDAVVTDVRRAMLSEFARSVVHNRAQNTARTQARATGISLMVLQLALAFFLVAIISIHDRFVPEPTRRALPMAYQQPSASRPPKPPAPQPQYPVTGVKIPGVKPLPHA
jgi:hypothetical protein